MTNEFLEDRFKELIYMFGEYNFRIITNEAWNEYINNDKKFTDKQLDDLRGFIKSFFDDLTDEPGKYD